MNIINRSPALIPMKSLKLAIRVAVSAFVVSAGAVAYAITPVGGQGTTSFFDVFVFNAAPGTPDFLNGSSITVETGGPVVLFNPSIGGLSLDRITSWDMLDSSVGVELTPQNSQVLSEQITDFNHLAWNGAFSIGGTDTIVQRLGNADTIIQRVADVFNGTGSLSTQGLLSDSFIDPPGTWNLQSSTPVPDAVNGMQLLALALGGLAVSHLAFRRQAAVAVRE
jgi:hypothetical protein